MSKIVSLELEKQVISGLLQYPEVYGDFAAFINEYDFTLDILRTIFCIIRKYLSEGKSIDKIIIGQEIKNLSITFEDDLNIFDFLNALSLIQINKQSIITLVQ